MSEMDSRSVTCVIAGGGPAGLMAGFLFARAGVRVLVLEKHKDFLRDFRGDTIHASTFEVMWELGLLDRFLRLPIVKVSEITGNVGGKKYLFCDFSRLPTKCKFIGFIPQWDFLNFLAKEGKRFPEFGLEMESEVTELLYADGRTCGLRYNTPQGPKEIRAQLVISAEGRDSHLRQAAQLEVKELGSEIDCLWFKLPWKEGDPTGPSGNNAAGSQLTSIYRGDYWQCALFIEKGGYDGIRQRGLAAFHEFLRATLGFAADRAEMVTSFDDVSLLTVRTDHLRSWARVGLLFIGDAAHAMSPVGGVGINYAIQDAVAAVNLLGPIFASGKTPSLSEIKKVQRRREWATKLTQRFQLSIQIRMFKPSKGPRTTLPLIIRLCSRWRWISRLQGRFLGIGLRPEHVRFPPPETSNV